ncbi:MAG: histidinol dehydrogenase, partial [Chitinivibrionales bacterium]|nr:histidinol dehydrogenase [Chitinivibrionales bacterium]
CITICIAKDRRRSIEFINRFAPEHLQIMTASYKRDCKEIRNAGAVFLGPFTPVALGDYYIGTNHVLPTGSSARFASPLGVLDFCKRMSLAEVTAAGLRRCGRAVGVFARAERLIYHALSVEKRMGL